MEDEIILNAYKIKTKQDNIEDFTVLFEAITRRLDCHVYIPENTLHKAISDYVNSHPEDKLIFGGN